MGPLTYKVFNIYSIRCGAYNSHLHTTLPLKCESINSSCSPLKRKLLFACTVVAAFSATDRHCTAVAAFCANGLAASVVPFVERGSDTTVGSRGSLGGPTTSRLEQLHKQERRHTLTQNLKAMGLWVLLLIRRSTFTILSDVGHITHTCTQYVYRHQSSY